MPRRWKPWSLFSALALLLLPFGVRAEPESYPKLELQVGETIQMETRTSRVQCDDPDIVQFELVSDLVLRVTGVKVGKTICAIWYSPGLRHIREVIVTPAKKR